MIIYDEWLSSILGKKVYSLDAAKYVESIDENISQPCVIELKSLLKNNIFMYAKVETSSITVSSYLEGVGFYLVDTSVFFQKEIRGSQHDDDFSSVRAAEPKDMVSVSDVAYHNFIYSRFHRDPQISLETANEIKKQWVANYFHGKRGDALFVCEQNGAIAGFIQVILKDNNVIIDLIATAKEYQRCGVATKLVDFLFYNYRDKNAVMLGTQIVNLPSINLYMKRGFRVINAKYIFHYHGE